MRYLIHDENGEAYEVDIDQSDEEDAAFILALQKNLFPIIAQG